MISTAQAQEKVVERSQSKAPTWRGTAQEDFIIVSSEKAVLNEAQEDCLDQIRKMIVSSISVHINAQECKTTQQIVVNGHEQIDQSYEEKVQATAARLPYITHISLSKAEIYWERRLQKKQKTYYYICHVKYPFSQAERNDLILQFKKQDNDQTARLDALKKAYDHFTELEYIAEAINDLNPLIGYFFDQRRKDEATALKQNYQKLYSEISIRPYENELGHHRFYFWLHNRRMTTSARAVLRSEFATNLVVRPIADTLYELSYDHETCREQDENRIDLMYRLNGHTLKYDFEFDPRQGKTQVLPMGEIRIRLTPAQDPATAVSSFEGWIDLKSKNEEAFEVEQVEIAIPSLTERLTAHPHLRFEGQGRHVLHFTAQCEALKIQTRLALAEGYLVVRNLRSGKTSEVSFALPYKIQEKN